MSEVGLPTHLGGGVYAQPGYGALGGGVTLTTERDSKVTNAIYLDPEALMALGEFCVERAKIDENEDTRPVLHLVRGVGHEENEDE